MAQSLQAHLAVGPPPCFAPPSIRRTVLAVLVDSSRAEGVISCSLEFVQSFCSCNMKDTPSI
jgi:hypothetical protein